MKTSAAGRTLIEDIEQLRLKAYPDSVGVWTIGYGHTSAAGHPIVKAGMVLPSKADADEILSADLLDTELAIGRIVHVKLTQNQFDALVSFTFNLGAPALQAATFCHELNAGNYGAVPVGMKQFNHAGGKVLNGLTKRRAKEAALWNKAA